MSGDGPGPDFFRTSDGPPMSGEGPGKVRRMSGEGPEKVRGRSGECPEKVRRRSGEGPTLRRRPGLFPDAGFRVSARPEGSITSHRVGW